MYARTSYDHNHVGPQYRNERREAEMPKAMGSARQQQRRELRRELAELED